MKTIDSETILDICSHILYYREMYKETKSEEYMSDERLWMRKLNSCLRLVNDELENKDILNIGNQDLPLI